MLRGFQISRQCIYLYKGKNIFARKALIEQRFYDMKPQRIDIQIKFSNRTTYSATIFKTTSGRLVNKGWIYIKPERQYLLIVCILIVAVFSGNIAFQWANKFYTEALCW